MSMIATGIKSKEKKRTNKSAFSQLQKELKSKDFGTAKTDLSISQIRKICLKEEESLSDNYKIINENILVTPVEEPEGMLIIPDTAKSVTQKGKVVGASESGDNNIKIDDIVLFKKKHSWNKISLDGVKYTLMKKYDVLGIMFGDDAIDVTPIKDYVFVEWEQAQDEYEGSKLIRPEAFKGMYYTGNVIHIGPDVKEVIVGDRIFFDQYCGLEKFTENGKRYTFIKEESIYLKNLPKRVTKRVKK